MLPGLHVTVFFFSALLTGVDVPPRMYKRTKKKITLVGSGDEVSADLCKLPDGVFPDPDNCDVFIRCQSGVPDVEPCPESLLFNPLKLTCDFSKTGNCSEPKDFDETSTPVQTNDVVCSEEGPNVYPITSSCTEYYMCDNDTAFKAKCPKNLLMNADKLTCDYPENVDCDSISSPEESAIGMRAVYEDDKDLESETKTSVTFTSAETSSLSAKTADQIKSETDFDSKEMTGYTLNDPEEITSAMLDATGNVISDKSVSPNPEITSTIGYLEENVTSKNPTLKETAQPKEGDSISETKPAGTNSYQDITGKTTVFTSTSNIKDEVVSSTSDAHRERSNLEDFTTDNNAREILTSPDTTVTDTPSNTFHDFTSGESSEQSSGDKSVTAIQTTDDKGINNEGSGSDIDIINVFTTDSNNASELLDVSTSDATTSNNLISTVTNEHILNTKTFSSDKVTASDSLSGSLDNGSTLDSEVEFTTKITDVAKREGTETTKSEVSLSASYDLTNQTDVADNKASGDNLTSDVKSTETMATDFNFNESTTRSSVLISFGSLADTKNESSFQDTTKIPTTVVETENKIVPEKTLTTIQALMSSDPLTDNETTKITTSTFSETVKVTPKYMINTATTDEPSSFDAEISESTSLSDDQNEYEAFTESVVESNLTIAPESNLFTEMSTVRQEHIVSSQPTETLIISEANTEILEINDIASKNTISNEQSSLSNEISTSSLIQQNSEFSTNSRFINEVINTEAITSPKSISSEDISEYVVGETHDYISSETSSPVPTEIENLTKSAINEKTVMSHSTDLSKTSDSYLSSSTVTNTIFDISKTSMEYSEEDDSTISIPASVHPTNEDSTVSKTQMNNSTHVSNELTSENQYPTLTSTNLKLTSDDDLIKVSHLTTRQNMKVTEITFVETSDVLYSTSNSTEHPTTKNAFSGFTKSGGKDIDSGVSSLETQQPDETTEKIDLSSESDVTKVDQTYIDMYTNKSTLSLENSSSDESFTASTADLESITYNSSSADTNENLKLSSTEVAISSVSERSKTTQTQSSSDLTSTLLHTRTEVSDINVTNGQLPSSEDDFDSSKNTRINSKDTELPYEIHSSTLDEVSTNLSDGDVTSTKESLSSDLMTSFHHQSEQSTQISETGMDFDRITVSTSGITDSENILSTENKGTSTNVSRDNLNDKTTTDFIHTASNTIAGNASETILPSKVSTGQTEDSSPTSLFNNTDIFEISSDSLNSGSVTQPGATLISSENSGNFKHVSTDPYTLKNNSTESTTEINKTPDVSKETSKAFDNYSIVNTTVVDIGTTSISENKFTNMYEESSTSDVTDPFKITSGVTVSSVIESTNETSESFRHETKITTENSRTSILDASTTVLDLISDTALQTTISEVTSTVNTIDMDSKTPSSDISSPSVVFYSKDSFPSTSAITTEQNYVSTLSSLKINSEESTSDSSDSTHLILPITYFNDSDNSISTTDKASESPEYDSNNVTETSTTVITSTKASYSSDENINPLNNQSTKETTTTEFISTKLNSESPDTYGTSQFTGRIFEESSPNSQTNVDIVSRNTFDTEWPTKSNTDFQTIPSHSVSSGESTSDITSSNAITENTFKTSDTSTTTIYKETPEPETVSKNNTFPSSGSLVSSTDILYESTSLNSLKVTSETTSKTITETSHDITDDNILPTSTNGSMYSSEIDSSTVGPTEISESTDLLTDFKRETIPTTIEIDESLLTNEETKSTDSEIQILSTSSSTSKLATEISRESTVHATSFSSIIATETGNPFPITAMTRDTTKENVINGKTTETTPKTSNTDSISITSKTLPEDRETDYIFSTTDSSVVKTTGIKTTSSKDISESDLHTISTTEMTVLINDSNKRITESNTDFTIVSMASRNLDEEINSTEYSSTTYFPSDLRTETSHSSSNTDIESDNKEISSTDVSSQTTVTRTHSKDISESDLPLVSTVQTTVLIFNDTNKTTTESITDVLNVSITSRNIIGKTESTEDPSTIYIPSALRTETSHSSVNTDTESELQRISSTDIPSESRTTMNPICVTSEGSFPHPDDCNKFYRCTKGVPVQSSCVGNEHFDPVKRICTSPCLAKCDPNADCGTTESKTSAEESTSYQTTSLKDISSTSELYNTGTEETTLTTAHDYFTEDTTPNKISKSTSEETTTITNSASRSSKLVSSTEKLWTDSFTSDESPSSVTDINATEDLTESSSDDYMSSRSFENVTWDVSNQTSSDAPITSITVTYEITPETQTEVIEVTSSTIKTNTETSSSGSSQFTVNTDNTPETSGDGEDSSSTSTLTTSTKCENGDCLSSKSPTSATLVPFRLCPRNDFLSGPDCSEYLDCTGKVPKKRECPNGLHFNPSTRVCDWPYNADCGTPPKPLYEPTDLLKCPCKSCLIPSTKSCSHYYLCIGFTAYEMKCSNSLHFDKSRSTCNYAPLVDCSHLTSTSTTTEIEPTESSTKTSTVEISTTTKASTTPASFVCPSVEGLFRYPGNCGMFYQCANWFPHPFNCPGATHFSEITKRCEYPCDAKCDLTLNCGIPSTAPPRDPRCSCDNCRLPSPESCIKYIVCVNGRARIEYCPWGKTFDARRSTCDWAHKVACQTSAMCPERNGLFSHKDDCHKFVHCSNGIPYVKKCPSILEFDPIKKRCEWPNGRCNYLPVITRDVDYKNEEHRKGWKCPKTFGYYSVDQHCDKFYHCSFGTPTLKECSPDLLYNPRYQTCDWKKQVRCNSNRHLKPRKCRSFDHHVVCSEDRRPKLHVLCNMYYDCTAGRACAKQCPVGLYFNNMTGVCDLPENVKCLNPGEGDYSLKELSEKCASGEHGRQVNPTNDSCFYHCRQGKVVSGCCSKGHVYNLHKDKCERRTKSLRI